MAAVRLPAFVETEVVSGRVIEASVCGVVVPSFTYFALLQFAGRMLDSLALVFTTPSDLTLK